MGKLAFWIAFKFSGSSFTTPLPTTCPKYTISSLISLHLLGLITMLHYFSLLNTSSKCCKCSLNVLLKMIILSMYTTKPFHNNSLNINSLFLWKVSTALVMPIGKHLYLHLFVSVWKAVLSLLPSSKGICQYPDVVWEKVSFLVVFSFHNLNSLSFLYSSCSPQWSCSFLKDILSL